MEVKKQTVDLEGGWKASAKAGADDCRVDIRSYYAVDPRQLVEIRISQLQIS